MPYNYIARFEEVGSGDVGPIGGKNASLGERRWCIIHRNIAAYQWFSRFCRIVRVCLCAPGEAGAIQPVEVRSG